MAGHRRAYLAGDVAEIGLVIPCTCEASGAFHCTELGSIGIVDVLSEYWTTFRPFCVPVRTTERPAFGDLLGRRLPALALLGGVRRLRPYALIAFHGFSIAGLLQASRARAVAGLRCSCGFPASDCLVRANCSADLLEVARTQFMAAFGGTAGLIARSVVASTGACGQIVAQVAGVFTRHPPAFSSLHWRPPCGRRSPRIAFAFRDLAGGDEHLQCHHRSRWLGRLPVLRSRGLLTICTCPDGLICAAVPCGRLQPLNLLRAGRAIRCSGSLGLAEVDAPASTASTAAPALNIKCGPAPYRLPCGRVALIANQPTRVFLQGGEDRSLLLRRSRPECQHPPRRHRDAAAGLCWPPVVEVMRPLWRRDGIANRGIEAVRIAEVAPSGRADRGQRMHATVRHRGGVCRDRLLHQGGMTQPLPFGVLLERRRLRLCFCKAATRSTCRPGFENPALG